MYYFHAIYLYYESVHLYITRGSLARKRLRRWVSIEVFHRNRWKGETCEVHYDASRITIMEITNAVRRFLILRATCACAIWLKEADYHEGRGWGDEECRDVLGIERTIDTRTITYRALLISLMGSTTCDGLYAAGIKRNNAAGRSCVASRISRAFEYITYAFLF